ncbi:hypothetical protein BD626DRAFT_493948 [Schizophyllum amplum]|uniref:Uncharacterized protein n=1 Tax=Schizophyllum amplum TaxID=97359 RepID=A0A550CH64_9AGAR|nr:hypothetical protein BD626DRAFT_493948 [Auriculariopsis ampla]
MEPLSSPGCCIGPMALMVTYLDLSAVAHASLSPTSNSKVALTSTIRPGPTIDSEYVHRRHDCTPLRCFCTAFSAADVFFKLNLLWDASASLKPPHRQMKVNAR